jgi:hypothetical protein
LFDDSVFDEVDRKINNKIMKRTAPIPIQIGGLESRSQKKCLPDGFFHLENAVC